MSNLAANSNDLPTVEQLIDGFKSSDMKLAIAIQEERSVEEIRQASDCVEVAIEKLFSVDCDGSKESRSLYRFLVNRFVLSDSASEEYKRRVCEKLLNRP